MKVCVLCRAPILDTQQSVVLSDELGGGGPAHRVCWDALLAYMKHAMEEVQEPLPTMGERII